MKKPSKKNVIKALRYLAEAVAVAIAIAFGLTSCNVTRTITTQSSSVQKGDTSIVINTKTIESYNAIKNKTL